MTKKVMKLLNPSTGLMECRVCKARHVANIKPGTGGATTAAPGSA